MSTSQLLDKLLNNIEEEASTVDPWETASSRSTIRGIGSWSGKGIMAVGRSLINGVNYVNERVALARIASAQSTLQQKVGWRIGQHAPLVEKAYQDMLEYQRPGLYSRTVTIEAWKLILVELSRGAAKDIVNAALSHLGRTDVQIFIMQLAACALTYWTRYPLGDSEIVLQQKMDPVAKWTMHTDFTLVLGLIIKADRTLIDEIFDLEEFCFLLARGKHDSQGIQASPTAYMFRVIDTDYRSEYWNNTFTTRGRGFLIYTFVHYIAGASPEILQDAVRHTMSVIRNRTPASTESLCVGLHFAIVASLISKDASEHFLDLGIVDLIEHLLKPSSSREHDLYLRLIAALARHNQTTLGQRILKDTKDPLFFVGSTLTRLIEVEKLGITLAPGEPADDYHFLLIQFALHMINMVLVGQPPKQPLSYLDLLLIVHILGETELELPTKIKQTAARLLLYIIVTKDEPYDEIATALNKVSGVGRYALGYIYHTYLGSDTESGEMSRENVQELQELYRLAVSSQRVVRNPVERFAHVCLQFALVTTTKKQLESPALPEGFLPIVCYPSGRLETQYARSFRVFLWTVSSGLFDFIRSGDPPSEEEKKQRDEVVSKLREYVK